MLMQKIVIIELFRLALRRIVVIITMILAAFSKYQIKA